MKLIVEILLYTFQVSQLFVLRLELVDDLRDVDMVTNINLLDLFL